MFWPQVESSDSRNSLLEKNVEHASSSKNFNETFPSSLDDFSEQETEFKEASYAGDGFS